MTTGIRTYFDCVKTLNSFFTHPLWKIYFTIPEPFTYRFRLLNIFKCDKVTVLKFKLNLEWGTEDGKDGSIGRIHWDRTSYIRVSCTLLQRHSLDWLHFSYWGYLSNSSAWLKYSILVTKFKNVEESLKDLNDIKLFENLNEFRYYLPLNS